MVSPALRLKDPEPPIDIEDVLLWLRRAAEFGNDRSAAAQNSKGA
jgi:hypothetical protein